MLRIEVEVESMVAAKEALGEFGATEPSQLEGCWGLPIMDLKKLVWTVGHRFQLEKGESNPQHLKNKSHPCHIPVVGSF